MEIDIYQVIDAMLLSLSVVVLLLLFRFRYRKRHNMELANMWLAQAKSWEETAGVAQNLIDVYIRHGHKVPRDTLESRDRCVRNMLRCRSNAGQALLGRKTDSYPEAN